MDLSVMLEPVEGNGYRATAFLPAPVVAEGSTRDEAVERIRTLIGEKLAHVELLHIQIPTPEPASPWLAMAGSWRDNPELDEVEENIQAYRREVDAAAERL